MRSIMEKLKQKEKQGCLVFFWLEDAKEHFEETRITVNQELLTLITNCDS